MGNLMLAAHAEGIGSCWIHRAKEEFESAEGKAFLKSLGIEGDYEGIGTVCWDIQMEKSQKPCLEKRITFTA